MVDGDQGRPGVKSGSRKKVPSKLSKRAIDKLKSDNSRGERFYDSVIKGFGVVVYLNGTKSFFLDYGPRQHRRRYSLGKYGVLTLEQARLKARKLIGKIQDGFDPIEEDKKESDAQSFKGWSETYIDGLEGRKKKASIAADKLYLGRAAKVFGKKKLHKLTVADVGRFFNKQKKKGPITANRGLASLRTCLAEAWRQSLVPENVAMKVKPVSENPPRTRVLTDEEMSRFLSALETIKDPHVRVAFEILIATGARKSEVLNMKYSDLDLAEPEVATWRLEKPKSGKPTVKPLTKEIVKLIQELPRKGNYVVKGRSPFKARSDLKRPWDKIVKRAELEGITVHDIRRTFGLAVARTAGLHVASKLLGHSTIRVTEQVYAPLGISDLREAANNATKERVASVKKIRMEKGS